MSILWIIVAVAVLFLVWVIAVYNRFIRLVQRTKEAWADIDVQLKRRYDLIPNLVASVKGYMSHEAGTLEKVTAARAAVWRKRARPRTCSPARSSRSLRLQKVIRTSKPTPTFWSCSASSPTPKTKYKPRAASTTPMRSE